MSSVFDTIVAPITGTEGAAVAIVRLSGPESWSIAREVFSPFPEHVKPRYALYGRYSTGDDGLALPFADEASYTGEQSVELSVHGSRASVRALVDACVGAGARMARAGEFTERAFLNGRIDLTQAEGVRDTIEAATERQLRHANQVREGALRDKIVAIRQEVTGVLAAVEASVDFSEEIGELDRAAAGTRLERTQSEIRLLLATSSAGRILRRGYRIAIVGRPNAGKSSLLNALLGADRAIVTEVPGTTRDVVEEAVELAGIPCVLSDTAGIRESADHVERIGVERAKRSAEAADVIWYVFDGAEGWTREDEDHVRRLPIEPLIVANKSDLGLSGALPTEDFVAVSALSGSGLAELAERLARVVEVEGVSVFIDSRHGTPLERAHEYLDHAKKTLAQDLPVDLATVHLQAALDELGAITGETASADMLERIFRDFCIGK